MITEQSTIKELLNKADTLIVVHFIFWWYSLLCTGSYVLCDCCHHGGQPALLFPVVCRFRTKRGRCGKNTKTN